MFARRYAFDSSLQRREGDLDVAGIHLDVTGVHDAEVLEAVGAQGEAGSSPSCGRSSRIRMAIGPKRAPERADVPPSKGAPRITTCASAYVNGSSRSHMGTSRKVKSGPNCWPYLVIPGVFAHPETTSRIYAASGTAPGSGSPEGNSARRGVPQMRH